MRAGVCCVWGKAHAMPHGERMSSRWLCGGREPGEAKCPTLVAAASHRALGGTTGRWRQAVATRDATDPAFAAGKSACPESEEGGRWGIRPSPSCPTVVRRARHLEDRCPAAAAAGARWASATQGSSNPDRGERAPLRDVGPGVRTHGPRAPVFTVAPAPTRTPIHVGTVLCAAAAAGGALHGAVAQTHDPGSVNQHDPATEERLDAWVNAKRAKDYATADAIRAELQAHGVDAEAARPAVWAAAELCRAAAPGVAADAARSDDA
eukprot:gene51874-biopygen113384